MAHETTEKKGGTFTPATGEPFKNQAASTQQTGLGLNPEEFQDGI